MENENVENKEKLNKLLEAIDNAGLSDEIVDNMDFYQLSSYIQTLNMLDSLSQEIQNEGDE